MNDILIPFGGEYLALTPDQLEAARQRGREIMRPAETHVPHPQDDPIFDADGMEARTGIPASWWLEQARRGEVPHIRAGKYVRFRLNETLASLRAETRPTVRKTFTREIRLAASPIK